MRQPERLAETVAHDAAASLSTMEGMENIERRLTLEIMESTEELRGSPISRQKSTRNS
jgi:hypothetical protein